MARLVRIPIAGELLTNLFTNGEHPRGFRVEDGLPPGAVFSHSTFDPEAGVAHLFYEHEDFAARAPGDQVRAITPRITGHEWTEAARVCVTCGSECPTCARAL